MRNKVNMSSIANKIKFIYGDECEKNTAGIVIFSDGTNYFFDAEYKNKMSNEEVEALLLRGAVIFKDGKYYRPASFGNAEVNMVSAGLTSNDIPNLFFYGSNLPTTKDAIPLEMDYKSNSLSFHSYVTLKCQGSSSMNYNKKNFTVTFYEDENREKPLKKNFRGWGGQNEFCLKANWVDSTHSRNIGCARIAYDMVDSRPDSFFKQQLLKCPRNGVVDGFPIKLYFNGEFWGIYTLNIPKAEWMFNMDESNPEHTVLCAEINSNNDETIILSTQFRSLWNDSTRDQWSLEVGEYSQAVEDSLNRCISFVMTATDEEFHDNISDYFDLYSLLDYYCFAYLCCHLDGLGKNLILATYDGVIWGACLYDMDTTMGAWWDGTTFVSTSYKCPEDYQEPRSLLWERVVNCFKDELIDRYNELRKGALSMSNIISHIEGVYDSLTPNMKSDEFVKWPNIPSYDENTMTRFRNYMRDRAKYVDELFENGFTSTEEEITFTDGVTYTFSKVVNDESIDFIPDIIPAGVCNYEQYDIDNGDTITRTLIFDPNSADSIQQMIFGLQYGQNNNQPTNAANALLEVSELKLSGITTCYAMFRQNTNLTSVNMSNIDLSNTKYMNMMFVDSGIVHLDLSTISTDNVETLQYAICDMPNLTTLNVSNFNVDKVTDLTGVFGGLSSLTTLIINGWSDSDKVQTAINTLPVGDGASNIIYTDANVTAPQGWIIQ